MPGLDVAVADGFEGKAAGDVDQRVQPAEMLGGSLDRRLRLCRVGEVDAADLDALSRYRHLRGRMIDARNPRAARYRDVGDDLAKRAERAGHDNDFSLHDTLRRLNPCRLLREPGWTCNGVGIEPGL